jgi:hypothetical protein
LKVRSFPTKIEESVCFRHPMDDDQWNLLLKKMRQELLKMDWGKVQSLACSIRERIQWLDPIMQKYCELTCYECTDPCCDSRKIFFNRTDLLFLSAVAAPSPPGQTRTQPSGECRYLGSNGCQLARTNRPYVCVWFLCEAQMTLFGGESAGFQRKLIKVLEEIRAHRLLLEHLFELHCAGSEAGF